MNKPVQLPVLSFRQAQRNENRRNASGRSIPPLRTIEDSQILLRSLRQSREKWLTSALAKFPDLLHRTPQAGRTSHTITSEGTCSLEIGPHIFYGTKLFTVRYDSPISTSNLPTRPPTTPAAPTAPQASSSTSSSRPTLTATPDLIAQVNAASAKNPELKRLLAVAADQKATQQELEKLGALIQTIAATPKKPPPSVPPTSLLGTEAPASSISSDIVLEFAENPNQKWLLPLDHAVVERRVRIPEPEDDDDCVREPITDSTNYDIVISTVIPPKAADPGTRGALLPTSHKTVGGSGSTVVHPVTFTLRGASDAAWLSISKRTKSSDQVWRRHIARVLEDLLHFVPPRVYLQHRLAAGQSIDNLDGSLNTTTAATLADAGGKRKAPLDWQKMGPIRPAGLKVEVLLPRRSVSATPPASAKPTVQGSGKSKEKGKGARAAPPNAASTSRTTTLSKHPAVPPYTYTTGASTSTHTSYYAAPKSGSAYPAYNTSTTSYPSTAATASSSSSSTTTQPYGTYQYGYPSGSQYHYSSGLYPYGHAGTSLQAPSTSVLPAQASTALRKPVPLEPSVPAPAVISPSLAPLEPSPSASSKGD